MNQSSILTSASGEEHKAVCGQFVSLALQMAPYDHSVFFNTVSIVLCAINGLLCPVTFAGNILVFAAVLRKPNLRNSANTSILCLAFTDLMVGFFVQPSYIVYQASKITSKPGNFPCRQLLAYSFSGALCICMSFLALTLISLERYLAVFYPYRYIEKVNTRRVVAVFVSVWVFVCAILLGLRFAFGINSNLEKGVISAIILSNFIITTVVYIKIFRLVKRCNAQVTVTMSANASSSAENETSEQQPQTNSREAKASKTVAFVAGTLFLCFTPTFCTTIVDQAGLARRDLLYHVIYPIAETAVLLNSCVNPGIYVWRNQGIRHSLVEMLRNCPCSSQQ
ncbi:histamine H2 receptor-like [Acropora muricata]|uniref:histamine H2 receptor-like n=1 Tax=Acropora muricata TaxID=159855 RepID=UPI0034E3F907